jgi:hypothetical protein
MSDCARLRSWELEIVFPHFFMYNSNAFALLFSSVDWGLVALEVTYDTCYIFELFLDDDGLVGREVARIHELT